MGRSLNTQSAGCGIICNIFIKYIKRNVEIYCTSAVFLAFFTVVSSAALGFLKSL